MKKLPFRSLAILAIISIIPIAVVACGSGASDSSGEAKSAPIIDTVPNAVPEASTLPEPKPETAAVPAPEPESVGTVKLTPEDSPKVPAADVAAAPMDTKASSEGMASVDPVVADEPAEAPALLTSFNDYGFTLKLDLGAAVESAGWTEAEASASQGLVSFAYGGVNTNLVWGPPEERTPLTFLADTYNLLRASQPNTTFDSISEGDVTINGQTGVYGGFKATTRAGDTLGGGIIGAWLCPDDNTAFRLTLIGDDATVVQLRFDRMLDNFACATSG